MIAMGSVALKDIFAFPLWWYTRGFVYVSERLLFSARKQMAFFSVNVWVRNIFVPMYGQYDWQGRIISFFIRLLQIIARSMACIVWFLFLLAIALFYAVIPLCFVVLVILQIQAAV